MRRGAASRQACSPVWWNLVKRARCNSRFGYPKKAISMTSRVRARRSWEIPDETASISETFPIRVANRSDGGLAIGREVLQATETSLSGEEQGQRILHYALDFATRGEKILPFHEGERGSALLIVECTRSRVAVCSVHVDQSCGNGPALLGGRRDTDGAATIGVPFEDGESQGHHRGRGQRPTVERMTPVVVNRDASNREESHSCSQCMQKSLDRGSEARPRWQPAAS